MSRKKISKLEGEISFIEKHYNDYKPPNKEDFVIETAVTTTVQVLYDRGLFDKYDNTDQVMKDYLLVEVNDRRTPDLEEVIDVVQ